MSLPIIGGGNLPPPPTHKPLEPTKLMRIASDMEDRADEEGLELINLEFIEEHSEETGTPESHLLAALLASNIELERSSDKAFVVCAGKCQSWGSLDHLQHLLDVRRKRVEDGGQGFDIRVRSCLDRCEQPAVVAIETPDGAAVIPKANVDSLNEAIAQLMDD